MGHIGCSKQEDDVDRHLRQVLEEESQSAHELAVVQRPVTDSLVVVDAKRVQDSSQ